ncbi:unnamed protein product [Darwinula stevensoni]|uniref:Ig-like domain-containing protein n=1 Tax=Darwinula stevensoni TaxID=69355 RepID=A0A7R9A1K0_9CRUS|nr:unnamed protein product [Darwinula stevensoni]CAG0883702.1 unnamed protein product [Darwinula stevensoni]
MKGNTLSPSTWLGRHSRLRRTAGMTNTPAAIYRKVHYPLCPCNLGRVIIAVSRVTQKHRGEFRLLVSGCGTQSRVSAPSPPPLTRFLLVSIQALLGQSGFRLHREAGDQYGDAQCPHLCSFLVIHPLLSLEVVVSQQHPTATEYSVDDVIGRQVTSHDAFLVRGSCVYNMCGGEDDSLSGPFFVREPPSRVDFSNTTGAVVECAARAYPGPEVVWVRLDGSSVRDVPGLRQVLPNGTLIFPPFRSEDYKQEVHAQVYRCLARNQIGTIQSRDVHVRAVVSQPYSAHVSPEEFVIRGNTVLLKCHVPSYLSDFLLVTSWLLDDSVDIYPENRNYGNDVSETRRAAIGLTLTKDSIPRVGAATDDLFQGTLHDVVGQQYSTDVNKEHVILGNSALLKCVVPSFVADFVSVLAWEDDKGTKIYPSDSYVVSQNYVTEVNNEHVMLGNAAVVKCVIPSFVTDFVDVMAWEDSDGNKLYPSQPHVVIQFYEPEVLGTEYVIRGNTALLKCTIPSFVADFVDVDAWLSDSGDIYRSFTENLHGNTGAAELGPISTNPPSSPRLLAVVSQPFEVEADNEYVMRGNDALLKCEIPSFVGEFVEVRAWEDSDGRNFYPGSSSGKNDRISPISVVLQSYETEPENEFVIRGNTVVLKCKIPSHMADILQVSSWEDSDGLVYSSNAPSHGNCSIHPRLPSPLMEVSLAVVAQDYLTRVIDEMVLRGNTASLKCLIPSFIGDFIVVTSWEDSEGHLYSFGGTYVVFQHYEAQVYDAYAILGNTVILKCQIPPFVSDWLQVLSWEDSNGHLIHHDGKYLVLPSGELQIRDVGPEDGYKSYKCRTVHRLTGETRLSATAGKLVITEPRGNLQPTLKDSKVGSIREEIPSGGAEPRSDLAPRLADSRFRSASQVEVFGETAAIPCHVQAYPIPTFRYQF